MTKQEARQRIEKLRKEINRHRYLYHVMDTQEISDAALDSLKNELVDLEKQYPEFLTPDSPTQRVGGAVLDKFVKVEHTRPVLSLDDAFTMSDIADWNVRNEKILKIKARGYYCELKLDGLTVVLTYEDGIFVRGATRGDGRIGEDVTNNLKTIESIPLRLDLNKVKAAPRIIEVRGEAVMTKDVFDKLNQQQKQKSLPLYANPRNIAAGSIRQLDPKVTASRKLDCFVFELITDCGQKTHEESHRILAQMGFKTSPFNEQAQSLVAVEAYLKKWEKKRASLPYNTDGAVIVVNDIAQERVLGSIGKTERWMIAFKFPAEQATTIVEDIIVQVGRTGALTPVAVLKPVLLAGTTVSRATLHNEDEINRIDIRVGDTVIVQKAGDIIPDVVEVLKKLRTGKEKKYVFPRVCPICNSPVVRRGKEVAKYCSNDACYAQEIEGLIHAISKHGFDIDGLGAKIVEQLVAAGLIRDISDVFTLTKEDVLPLERFADKSANNIIDAISRAKHISLQKFIVALGIRHVGEGTARTLTETFKSFKAIAEASEDLLSSVPDIGPVVASSIRAWFKDKKNQTLLKKLFDRGVTIRAFRPAKSTGIVEGKTFVLTGTLSEPREVVAEKIRLAGGTVTESVSSRTSYVVAGSDPGSKYARAESLNVPILNEKELQDLLAGR